MIVMSYNIYLEQIFGIDGGDMEWVSTLVSNLNQKYPTGMVTQWFAARFEQCQGRPLEAIVLYNKCLELRRQTSLKSLANICYWDLAWCHA